MSALGGSRETGDRISQAAFVSHGQTLGRANFERNTGVIDNLDDQRPLARESSDSVKNVGQSPFREFSSGKS